MNYNQWKEKHLKSTGSSEKPEPEKASSLETKSSNRYLQAKIKESINGYLTAVIKEALAGSMDTNDSLTSFLKKLEAQLSPSKPYSELPIITVTPTCQVKEDMCIGVPERSISPVPECQEKFTQDGEQTEKDESSMESSNFIEE